MKPAILEEISKMLDIELNLARRRLALLMIEFGGNKWYDVSPDLFRTFKGIKDYDIETFKDKISSRRKSIINKSKKLDFNIHTKVVPSEPKESKRLHGMKVFIEKVDEKRLSKRDLELMLQHTYGAILVDTKKEADILIQYKSQRERAVLNQFRNRYVLSISYTTTTGKCRKGVWYDFYKVLEPKKRHWVEFYRTDADSEIDYRDI